MEAKKTIVLPTLTKEEFLRDVYITLAKNDAPFSAFESKTGEVTDLEERIFSCSGTASAEYSASIGYDRVETYIDIEVKREKVGDQWIEKKEPVSKTRTVTDWRPYTGKINEVSVSFIKNLDVEGHFSTGYQKGYYTRTDEAVDVSDLKYSKMLAYEEEIQEAVKSELPGDRYRDLKVNIVDTDEYRSEYIIWPTYYLDIECEGEKHPMGSFADKNHKMLGGKIPNPSGRTAEIKRKKDTLDPEVNKKTVKFAAISLGAMALSVLIFLLVPYLWINIVFLLGMTGAFVYYLMTLKKAEADVSLEIKQFCDNFTEEYNKQLLEKLNSKLSELGLENATLEEITAAE